MVAYTMRGGALIAIRSPFDDRRGVLRLLKLMEGWETWLESGRVSNESEFNGCTLFIKPDLT